VQQLCQQLTTRTVVCMRQEKIKKKNHTQFVHFCQETPFQGPSVGRRGKNIDSIVVEVESLASSWRTRRRRKK